MPKPTGQHARENWVHLVRRLMHWPSRCRRGRRCRALLERARLHDGGPDPDEVPIPWRLLALQWRQGNPLRGVPPS
jgi:hypothetical protein